MVAVDDPLRRAGPDDRVRLLLIGHRDRLGRHRAPVHRAFDRRFEVVRYFVENGWPTSVEWFADYERYHAIVWWVRFRELRTRQSFDWRGYRGGRIIYDWDVHQNYFNIGGPRDYRGAFPEVIRRLGFELLACSGYEVAERMRADGIPTLWLPKAFDPTDFYDLGTARSGVCHFGRLYPARRAMLRDLRRADLEVIHIAPKYEDLNAALNRFRAAVVCNMEASTPYGWRKWAAKALPWFPVTVRPGPEALIKNFEVPAAGCTLVCDEVPDLPHLGFRDGVTALTYRTLAELRDKLTAALEDTALFARIATQGRKLSHACHTWDHRMERLGGALATLQREGPDAFIRGKGKELHG